MIQLFCIPSAAQYFDSGSSSQSKCQTIRARMDRISTEARLDGQSARTNRKRNTILERSHLCNKYNLREVINLLSTSAIPWTNCKRLHCCLDIVCIFLRCIGEPSLRHERFGVVEVGLGVMRGILADADGSLAHGISAFWDTVHRIFGDLHMAGCDSRRRFRPQLPCASATWQVPLGICDETPRGRLADKEAGWWTRHSSRQLFGSVRGLRPSVS